ncbi:EAL domain-containing protein [Deinococcus navajonensis]|uniref:EAL domain-containing protein n=1 Tax=Deinococcus navajonensis TaxID=309884 RepID=A0ABV8XKJ5_9DEIO
MAATPVQLYEGAFQAAAPTLAILDPDGTIVDVNESWKEFADANQLGLPRYGVGTNYLSVCEAGANPEAQEVADGIRSVLNGQAPEYVHLYPCHSPTERRWFQLRVTRFGRGPQAVVVHEDISEVKRTEEHLRRQMDFIHALLTHIPDDVHVLDLDGRVLWANGPGPDLLELSVGAASPAPAWIELWTAPSRAGLQDALNRARAGEASHTQAIRASPEGTLRFLDVIITPLRDPAGRPARLLASTRDITPLREAQEAAAHEARLTHRILTSIEEAFFALDERWHLTYLNPSAEALLRRPAREVLGQRAHDVFSGALSDEVLAHARTAVRTQQHAQFETFARPFNAWLNVNISPHETGVTVVIQNVTARKAEAVAQTYRRRILEMTVEGRPLPDILDQVVQAVETQRPGHVCVLMLINHGRLYIYAAPRLPEALRLALNGTPVGQGLCGQTAASGEAMTIEDLATDPSSLEWRPVLQANRMLACHCLPIQDGEQNVLGVLTVYAPTAGPLPAETIGELERARSLAAVAIEHHRLPERLVHQAHHDPLTGLANRQLFEECLQQALDAARRMNGPVSLLFIDMNDFKGVNDSFGHQAGDQVLREMARRLLRCAQHGDTVCRISGDEFTVILPFAPEADAVQVATRITEVLTHPIEIADRSIHVTASIGIAVTSDGGMDAETLQRCADLAMYHAKHHQAGFAVFHSDMNRRAYERFQLVSFLRQAQQAGELELHYQPQVDLRNGVIFGVEALLRWQHSQLGMVQPEAFISAAEETGLIVPIGAWTLAEACRQGALWRQQGHPELRVAVNVSALQFEQEDFVDVVARHLDETGFPPEHLELELTERVVMRNVESSVARMRQLRNLGVMISVDDFGTGYSSLNYLSRLPLNVLKIDGSFVRGLSPRSPNFPVVRAILGLARSFQLEVIAEGIETALERQTLEELGCCLGQGHLFAPPCRAAEVFPPI